MTQSRNGKGSSSQPEVEVSYDLEDDSLLKKGSSGEVVDVMESGEEAVEDLKSELPDSDPNKDNN